MADVDIIINYFILRRIIMCKRLVYLACFVFVLVVLPPATHAQVENLLLNQSFEEDEPILDDPD